MKKLFILFIVFSSLFFVLPSPALAMCPVCTVAVAGGLGLSRWLGIDDVISGIWIGGLILSSSLWFYLWLSKKYPKFKSTYYMLLTTLLGYLLVLIPLYYYEIVGHPFNQIFGIDKLIFGTAVGSLGFLLGVWLDNKVRKVKGKQLFNYQKVVFPVGTLLLLSLIFYFLLPYLK